MRRILVISGCAFAAPLWLAACATQAPPPAVVTKVIDYRNGWYHPASGAESLVAIAERYGRDAKLVASLNQVALSAAPPVGMHVYIPPVHDPDEMKIILARIRSNPGIVPISPPDEAMIRPVKSAGAPVASARMEKPTPALPSIPAALSGLPEIEEESPSIEVASVGGASPETQSPRGRSRVALRSDPPNETAPAPVLATRAGGSGLFAWPVEGEVVESFTGSKGTLKGIVIRANDRAQVRAAGDGKIIFAAEFEGYGKVMMIEHKNDYITVYGYNESLSHKKGDKVKKGDAIAIAGKPTASSDTQVFFQVRKGKTAVDPMKLLP